LSTSSPFRNDELANSVSIQEAVRGICEVAELPVSTTKLVIDFSGVAENKYTSKNLLNQVNE